MFGIDFSEILVIFGIALVVLGPERLPKVAATIGRWIGRARAMARQFREQLEQETGGLQQSMNLGPEFDPRTAAAAAQSVATAATPNIRPPANSTPTAAPDTPLPSAASIAAAQEAIAPSPAAAIAETVEAESSFEYGLAHTHISALHPAPASSANSAVTSAHANGAATHDVAAADPSAVTGPGEPQQHTLWPS